VIYDATFKVEGIVLAKSGNPFGGVLNNGK
jgi:hypothetical protein